MGDHSVQVLLPHSGEGQEAVVDCQLDLADDVEAVPEEEVVVPVDRPAQGVLHREDGPIGDPELHRLESHLELVARDRLALRVRLPRRRLRVRAGDSLVRHAHPRPMNKAAAKEEANRIKAVTKDSAGSKIRRNIYLGLIGLLVVSIADSFLSSSADWRRVAVLGAIVVGLITQVVYEQSLLSESKETEKSKTKKNNK